MEFVKERARVAARPPRPVRQDERDALTAAQRSLSRVLQGAGAVSPAVVGNVQRLVGNAAAVKLLVDAGGVTPAPKQDNDSPAVQRLVVNVDAKKLPELDLFAYKTMHIAFKELPDQDVREFDHANYRTDMKTPLTETVYFVGHGSPGQVGDRSTTEVVDAITDPVTGLSPGYVGSLTSLSCSTGVHVKRLPGQTSGVESAVSQVVRGLRAQQRKGITVTGARGASLRHATHGTRIVKPRKLNKAAAWQGRHVHNRKDHFEAWKLRHASATPQEWAAEASRRTEGFLGKFMAVGDARKWLLDEGKSLRTRTS